MPNTEKIAAVAELSDHFSTSSAAVITEYRGLSVKQITDLRRALGRDTTFAVVKNTLTKRAAADAGVSIGDDLLSGPTAIAFVKGDPVEAAKGLRDFAKTNPLLVIKGGYLDGKALSAAEIGKIADLESREVLLAKVAGAVKALPTRAAGLFQAPLSQMARLVKALEEKTAAESPATAAPEASVADSETAAVAVEDTTAAVAADDTDAAVAADTTDAAVAADTTDAAVAADDTPEAPAEPAE